MTRTDQVTTAHDDSTARIQLSDNFSVAPEFYDAIRFHIQERLQHLRLHHYYEAKQLAGAEFWDLMDRGDQRLAGRCIANMVSRGLLPLARVKGKHEYPLRYELK